jgi:guanosine-3',5'-bis(diphosphate) 3'-pyrophosphohydrolase
LVKLADKICNLRDVASNPPTRWKVKRQIEYFDWAKSVIDALRGTHPRLEALFDAVYEERPHAERWTRHVKPEVRGPHRRHMRIS